MQITTLEEPYLLFGTGKHVDIRYGLRNFCPLDFDCESAPKKIRLGVVGDSKSIEELKDWLEKCRGEIEAKKSHQRNLFPNWPGFNTESVFFSELQFDSSLERQISSSDIKTISSLAVRDEQIIRAVDLIVAEVQLLLEKKPDVIACAIPQELLEALNPGDQSNNLDDDEDIEKDKKATLDFHHLLKAKCMTLPRACPIQLVLPATYNSKYKRRGRSRKDIRPLQDEATRAWNFHTALYYKAGGIPWKLQEDSTKLQTCFVGVGFYKTLDQERILTSVAQVFNERGNGVVVRGEQAIYEKEDRQIHLEIKQQTFCKFPGPSVSVISIKLSGISCRFPSRR
ncbi:hypothetical protein Enr10x_26230 [Gimesia panareensis]|uniref:Uncharacterized protein n=1 Tax=Gimesia panareensis TaxID=2527978 RepID=A0A517Q6T1_9PLAN|nr:hypothetical protein [Gimesia panareensis]QDT27306.1 hypothetical protein Enr10x_26230 [Gimesia panareensis]